MSSVEEIDAFLNEALSHGLADGQALTSERDPRVILTYAQSLDARIAGAGGTQLVLSGKESMAMTHRSVAARITVLWCRLSADLMTPRQVAGEMHRNPGWRRDLAQ